MSEVTLVAESRTEFGKGAARRLRRAHQIPAVIYGHGEAPVHVALPGHTTMLALKKANALLSVVVDGVPTLALVKSVQRDPIRPVIEHVDLILVKRGEKVTVDVSVQVVGDTLAGATLTQETTSLSLEVEATSIPTSVQVDVTPIAAGGSILASQVALPEGATLIGDPEAVVVAVAAPVAAAEDDAPAAE